MRIDTWHRILILLATVTLAVPVAAACADPSGPAVPAAHEQAACKRCHFGTSTADGKVPNARCTGCHNLAVRPASSGFGSGFHADADRSCVSCHFFHKPASVLTAAGPVDLAAAREVDAGHCVACHDSKADRSRLNVAHRQAAALYHARSAELTGASPSQGCLNCHDQASDSGWMATTEEAPITFGTHATHPLGIVVRPGSGFAARRIRHEIDPRIPLFDGRIACQSCHDLTAGTKDLVRTSTTPREMCLGCHQVGPDETAPLATLPVLAAKN